MGAGSLTQVSVSALENGHECVDSVSVPQGINAHPLGAAPHAPCTSSHQHCPQHSLQCSTTRVPCWPTNSLRESEQWHGDCEFRFAQQCAQPVWSACSSLRWDSERWLQCAREVLLQPGLTRAGQIPLSETNIWLTMKPDLVSVSPVLNAMAGASVPCSAGHSQVAQPRADGTCNPLPMGEPFSPLTRHQKSAHKLSAYAKQPPVGSHYVGEDFPRINVRSVPCSDDTSDDDNYQPGLGAQSHYGTHELGLAHSDSTGDARSSYLTVTGMRHLPGPCLLPCQGKRSLAFCDNLLWTRGLPDHIPMYVWHKCKTSKEMKV